jgi:hypothetical protein
VGAVRACRWDLSRKLLPFGSVNVRKAAHPKNKDLAQLECLAFGGCDIYEDGGFEAAVRADV